MGKTPIAGQMDQDLAAGRRERGGVVDQVFEHGFDHLLAAEDHKSRQQIGGDRQVAAGQHDRQVAAGQDVGAVLGQPADDSAEIDLDPRLGEEICGRLIEPASRGDEAVEPVDRVLDDAKGALGALIVFGQRPPQRLERLADDRDRRLEGVGVVLRGAADIGRRAVQGVDHAVELGGDVGQFGEAGAAAERSRIGVLCRGSAAPAGRTGSARRAR